MIKTVRKGPSRVPEPLSEQGVRNSRWSIRGAIALRLAFALVVAAGLTYGLFRLFPAHLSSSYGVVGFPTFANYNIEELLRAYQLGVIGFPVLVLVAYGGGWLLSWRIGLPVERLFAARWVVRSDGDVEYRTWLPATGVCVPALIIGAVLGLQGAMWQARAPGPLLVEVAAFSLIYLGVSVAVGRALHAAGAAKNWGSGAHLVNMAVAPVTIVAVSLVSATTTVTVSSTHHSYTYEWFPFWVSIPLAGAVGVAAWIWLRWARQPGGERRADHALVALVAVPVALFLLMARLPGALAAMNTFEEGQYLAAGSLAAQGYRYWVDLVSLHGIFLDVWSTQIGFALFGPTRWGGWAGQYALLAPLTCVLVYYLFAYLLWRRWHWILLVVIMIIASELAPINMRFVGWPLPFLLLGLTLKTRRGLFAVAAVIAAIGCSLLIPEMSYVIPGVAIGVILADLQGWKRDRGVIPNLRLSWFSLAGGIATTLVLAIGLASTGYLTAFIQYYLDFVPAHEVSGGIPLPLGGYATVSASYWLQLAISLAGLMGILLYFGRMIYRGERPSDRDVVVGSLAVVAFLYFPQYLSRADPVHLSYSYLVVLPVALHVMIRLVSSIKVTPSLRIGQGIQWLTIVLVVLIVVGATPAQQQVLRVAQASSNFRQVVKLPASPGMGYETSSSSQDDQLVSHLQPFVSRYVGRDQWLFDFTNSTGLFYYLLNIHPRTRFYNVQLAFTASSQAQLVDQLKEYQPAVVAFDDQTVGFPGWDFIPNEVREYLVSQYILAHYEPLTEIDSYAFFIRKGVSAPPLPPAGFPQAWPPVPASQLYWGPKCSWGTALNYLTYDQPQSGSARSGVVVDSSTSVTAVDGWAFDKTSLTGASQVLAVQGGRVVSIANADMRTSVQTPWLGEIGSQFIGFYLPVDSGDTLSAPVSVLGLSGNGHASMLTGSAPLPSNGYVPGTSYRVTGQSIVGAVNGTTRLTEQVISPPRDRDWSRYGWMAVRLASRSVLEHVSISDGNAVQALGTNPYVGPSHVISFDALPGPQRTFYVPVASCPQWFGYGSAPLTVSANAPGASPAISLVQ